MATRANPASMICAARLLAGWIAQWVPRPDDKGNRGLEIRSDAATLFEYFQGFGTACSLRTFGRGAARYKLRTSEFWLP